MKIVRSLEEITFPSSGSVVTIGNFDGVHLGHREIFRKVVTRASETGAQSVVLTFLPHPLKVLRPQNAPLLINTYEEKERLVAASQVDLLVSLPFDHQLAAYSADRFVEEILVRRLNVKALIVGYDYAFGKGRGGDAGFLKTKGADGGFSVEVLGPITDSDGVYSSSRIRQLVLEGNVSEVIDLLGRNFTLEGRVVHGKKRGKSIGFPTANLETTKELIPRSGVYAVKTRYGEDFYDGVVNIGCNPTFHAGERTIEVHIFGFSRDIYDETVRIYFVERLRDEMVFASIEELCRAINADIERAKIILERCRLVEFKEYLPGDVD